MKKNRIIYFLLFISLVKAPVFSAGLGEWLNDKEPPGLTLRGMEKGDFLAGTKSLTLELADQSKIKSIEVMIDGKVIFKEKPGAREHKTEFSLDESALEEGDHLLKIKVIDSAAGKNSSIREVPFTVDRTPPVLTLEVKDNSVSQGNVHPLVLFSDEPRGTELILLTDNRKFPFYKDPWIPGRYKALISFSAVQPPGDYPYRITARDGRGNTSELTGNITVTAFAFPNEVIVLPPAKSGLLTDTRALIQNREKLAEAQTRSGEVQLWEGKFLRPTEGRVSSIFGIRRVFNTGQISSYHKGLDLANAENTPIYAANRGMVVLAEELPIHGNTVVIDHGQFVFSIYSHMRKIEVSPEEPVEKGHLLGLMGQTGLATGPHLHWEIKVNQVSVNPVQWEQNLM